MPPANTNSEEVEATQGAVDGKVPLKIKVNDKWVDLRVWKFSHPGGTLPLERYANEDATDAFAALHSRDAWRRLEKLPAVTPPAEYVQPSDKDVKIERNFRALRERLARDGWFKRNVLLDAAVILHVPLLAALGTLVAWRGYWTIATLLIGVAMEQAGWAAHDYAHARDGTGQQLIGSMLGGIFNGFSLSWWSRKHNTHHVHPNQRGIDDDIDNEPILHLAFPREGEPVPWYRQYQHYYYHAAFCLLFVSWRAQSTQSSIEKRRYDELALQALGYVWLATLPWPVALGAVLLGGFLAAEVVTASHQSEEMFDDIDHRFVHNQFLTTRDVHEQSTLLWWLYGGMNYQTIHHLFPTMPRYYYGKAVPIVAQFAKENGIEYKTATTWEILKMNFETMRRYAAAVDESNKKFN